MKKLEYSPRCMKANRQSVDTVNYMIATHTNTLMIYSNSILKWAAQLNHTPVQIDFCSMRYISLHITPRVFFTSVAYVLASELKVFT